MSTFFFIISSVWLLLCMRFSMSKIGSFDLPLFKLVYFRKSLVNVPLILDIIHLVITITGCGLAFDHELNNRRNSTRKPKTSPFSLGQGKCCHLLNKRTSKNLAINTTSRYCHFQTSKLWCHDACPQRFFNLENRPELLTQLINECNSI